MEGFVAEEMPQPQIHLHFSDDLSDQIRRDWTDEGAAVADEPLALNAGEAFVVAKRAARRRCSITAARREEDITLALEAIEKHKGCLREKALARQTSTAILPS